MIDIIDVKKNMTLRDYASYAPLSLAVRDLETEAAHMPAELKRRKVWMLNSTAHGGGVAEMLPMMVGMLRELGWACDWLVMRTKVQKFFSVTKQLHNMIHGQELPALSQDDQAVYGAVSADVADSLSKHVQKDDLFVVHDPQPAGAAALVKERSGTPYIWRCHIGLDERRQSTSDAWRFLQPYVEPCSLAVFSASEYIPDYLAGRAHIIHPALDPLSHKNRDLHPIKLTGILCNAGLMRTTSPVVREDFTDQAQRLRPDGTFGSAIEPEEIGILFRPIVTQVSRWDRLKGWTPLLRGFVQMKERFRKNEKSYGTLEHRRMETVRLVLAGPDPESVQDDPEGQEVLAEICDLWLSLPAHIQKDIAILALPMSSPKNNALMVNALQRASSIVVQNSVQEGFGLTATEAMWKGIPVLASDACGLRQQIRNDIDGVMLNGAEDPEAIGRSLERMLNDVLHRDLWGRSAQRRVYEEFLIFAQLKRWIRIFRHSRAQAST